jgi:hypothetical protein
VTRLPIETFFIILVTLLGILIELIAGFNRTYDSVTHQSSFSEEASNLQHFAMYLMFLLAGMVQLLLHYNFPLPKYFDLVVVCLAFSSEALIFYFHGHGPGTIEVQIHVCLALTIGSTVICGVFEIIQQEKQVYATLMRSYFTVLQGAWFYTTGFFLYNPFHEHYQQSTDPDVHRTAMLLAYYFVLEMAITFFLVLILSIPAYFVSKRQHHTIDFMEYGELSMVNHGDEEMEKLNGTINIQ